MKLQYGLYISAFALALTLSSGISCGAATQTGEPASTGLPQTPELMLAESQLSKVKAQLALARKQLNAARANVRACESEFKAARAQRDAVAMRNAAQVEQDKAMLEPPVPVAYKEPVTRAETPKTKVQDLRQAPAQNRAQRLDFNAEPQAQDDQSPLMP